MARIAHLPHPRNGLRCLCHPTIGRDTVWDLRGPLAARDSIQVFTVADNRRVLDPTSCSLCVFFHGWGNVYIHYAREVVQTFATPYCLVDWRLGYYRLGGILVSHSY